MFVCICENVRTWVSDCTTFMALICEHLYWLLYSSSMFALCSNVCKSFKLISYLQIHFAIVFRCLCRTQVELRVSRGESYTGKATRIYTGIGLYIDHSTTFCKLSLCWIFAHWLSLAQMNTSPVAMAKLWKTRLSTETVTRFETLCLSQTPNQYSMQSFSEIVKTWCGMVDM